MTVLDAMLFYFLTENVRLTYCYVLFMLYIIIKLFKNISFAQCISLLMYLELFLKHLLLMVGGHDSARIVRSEKLLR